MKFKIESNSTNDRPKEGFYLRIDTYVGDADAYQRFDMGPFPQSKEEFLAEVVTVLEDMRALHNERTSKYIGVKNFDLWFRDETPGWIEEDDPRMVFLEDAGYSSIFQSYNNSPIWGWPYDANYDAYYRLDKYEVFYIDASGNKHSVTIERDLA